MKRLQFSTKVRASANKTHDTMLGLSDIATYEHWTKEFNPGSTYKGDWTEGSKILFVGTSEDGKQGGMVSEIAAHNHGSFVSIRHYGILDGEKEITSGPEVEKWTGGLENYAFKERDGITEVIVDIDVTEDFEGYFNDTWPKALDALKKLAES